MKAIITDIKRFAVHDGDGIRTTVFLKGCPMRCLWCHNPEGLRAEKQIAFYAHKCTGCGACAAVCAHHVLENGVHTVNRDACLHCGKCATVCPQEALRLYGREMTVDEVFSVIAEDKAFYDSSGGGVTLSGGECLLYPDFCAALLQKCKEAGIHTAVDTSGYVQREAIDAVFPYTDVFLYDVKAIDDTVHIRCTGVSNARILKNLRYIDEKGGKTEIRFPCVPSCNDKELAAIEEWISSLQNMIRFRVLPYHDLYFSKYEALGMQAPKIPPSKRARLSSV